MEHQFPLPGVAAFILSVGLASLVFFGILLLAARAWPNNPVSDALTNLWGAGAQEA